MFPGIFCLVQEIPILLTFTSQNIFLLPTSHRPDEELKSNRNMGKYEALALADSSDAVVNEGRKIFMNGLNQVKILCDD